MSYRFSILRPIVLRFSSMSIQLHLIPKRLQDLKESFLAVLSNMKPTQMEGQMSVLVPNDILDILHDKLIASKGFEVKPVSNKYEMLRGRLNDKLVIVYHSGRIVYEASDEIRKKIEEVLYERYRDEGIVVGSDEAGKGEAVGPLVIAAVALDPRQAAYLQSLGVADSKLIPERNIGNLARLVRNNSISYKVLTMSPDKFNKIFESARRVDKNLNDILASGHSKVLRSVVSNVDKPMRIVVDEFDVSKSGFRIRMIESSLRGKRVSSMPRAEIVPAVSAASVLARDKYLRWLKENLTDDQLACIKKGDLDFVRNKDRLFRLFKISYLKRLAKPSLKRRWFCDLS